MLDVIGVVAVDDLSDYVDTSQPQEESAATQVSAAKQGLSATQNEAQQMYEDNDDEEDEDNDSFKEITPIKSDGNYIAMP